MTEQEWLSSKDPVTMLETRLQNGYDLTSRKVRLYFCACCRHAFNNKEVDSNKFRILKNAEKLADGEISSIEFSSNPLGDSVLVNMLNRCEMNTPGMCRYVMAQRRADKEKLSPEERRIAVLDTWEDYGRAEQADLLREIFGNPWKPIAVMEKFWQGDKLTSSHHAPTANIEPDILTWNDGTIPKIAQSIYTDKLFAEMPVLADALEEAGCTNKDVLDHCRNAREKTTHVRGCWVLDLLLGKK